MIKKIIPQRIKNIFHLGQAIVANLFYKFPSRKIRVIGVTGTNGKTTTCQMIAKILEESGKKVAMASTINFKMGEKEWVNATKYTTLSSCQVQKFIKEAVSHKCDYLVLEISSHSLDQYRVFGINYQVAVITNITREHLDYHETMEKYRKAKIRLFKKSKTVVVNLDMEKPEDFLEYGEEKYGYTIKSQKSKVKSQNCNSKVKVIKAENIKLEIDKSQFTIHSSQFTINLPGLFNVENALAATCVGLSQGISLENIKQGLEKIKIVPGRLEHVKNDRNIEIIIDYAVTPDSLDKLYDYIKSIRKEGSKIVSVFGACGERDRGKRPIMGEIVDKYADSIILTNEDPYFEDPWQIINEVAVGIKNKKEGENFWKIMDRRQAIKKALQLARPGDIVAVTGKGAEEIMAVKNERISWNDRRVILEELNR